ncbi:Hypothetical protein J6891_01210 [Nakaseomyces glabratus]|nr:hypothetical protein J7298_01218 [Nakaseomyces glabratus]KAH7605584.1 hypothetical protein J7295_01219 [Nakaseomyces glabratus]KAH7614589.1 hypothetical protein J7292_01199 [Nakaseomyces glabratus]
MRANSRTAELVCAQSFPQNGKGTAKVRARMIAPPKSKTLRTTTPRSSNTHTTPLPTDSLQRT